MATPGRNRIAVPVRYIKEQNRKPRRMEETVVYAENICEVRWWTYALLGFLAVLFGLLIILFPKISTEVIVILFGILLLILGIMAIIYSILPPMGEKRSVLKFIGGVLAFLIGIASIALPFFIAVAYIIILAIVAFVIGLLLIILAITESGYPHRWLVFLMGILSIIFAILLMFYPLIGSIVVIGILTGIYLIILGILSLALGFSLRSVRKLECA
jgi:uncharacterized membrane protein HdeD (DUF308 family)